MKPGLDDILSGGLIPNRLYLVDGGPGSGKTTLSLQFLLERPAGRREVSLDQPTRGSGRSVRPVGTRRFSHAWRRITAFDHGLFGMIKRHPACAINIVSVNALKADNYRFKDLSLANRPR